MKKQYFHAPEQKEETKHGEPYFPVQKYITRLSEEYPAVTTHWHEEAELTLIVKGKCHYQVDLVDYEVKEGDLFRRYFCMRFQKEDVKNLFRRRMYFI